MKLFRRKTTRRRPTRRATSDPRSMLMRQIVVGVVICIVLTLVLTGVWYGTRVAALQISDIQVIGGKTISHDHVRSKVQEQLSGTYFKLIPRQFQPLYPEADVIASLKVIPRMDEVRLTSHKRGQVTVVFTEYKPHALWCSEGETAQPPCFFIDHTGYAFAPAPKLNGNALVRYFIPDVTPRNGQWAGSREVFNTAELFIEKLQTTLDLYVTEVHFLSEFDTDYVLASGAAIKTSNRLTAEETVENLAVILSNESFAHLSNGNFHYIDLRFGDKVYVSEEEYVPEVATSTATSTLEME